MREISSNVWIKDSRHEDSPFESAFVHESEFPSDFDCSHLPNRNLIVEFDIEEHDKGVQAQDIDIIYKYS
jgi:cold shock CspA family protein